jgi:PAS domain S-box-containing protein
MDILTRTDWTDVAVRHHLTLLAQVAQATSSAVIITDDVGVIVWVNEGFTRITGYSFEEVIGQRPGELLQGPDTDSAEVARIRKALRSRQSVAAELINYAKDGRRYWIGMTIEPLLAINGAFDGFMAIETDITDKHEEQLAIRQITRRFNLATKAANVGVFERDANWEILWWSDVMWDVFGQDPATFKPTHEAWLGLIHPDDRERIKAEVSNLRKNPGGGFMFQYRAMRPDGTVRHIRSIGAPADIWEGNPNRIAGIAFDVTERVEAAQREQMLQQKLRESSHKAGMAEIATGVLHNVGNVLNSLGIANSTARRQIQGLRMERLAQASELLLSNRETIGDFLTKDERGRHLPDYLPALSAQMIAKAQAIQSELEVTEQLLHHLRDVISAQQDLARIGGGREPVRLADLVDTALLLEGADLAHVNVERHYDDLPLVMTDRHKLLQIVVNLLSNACDAVSEGASGTSRVAVRLAREGDHALLTVEDSGVGMSAEVLAQIWQFGFTTKKAGHGFGLHNSANAAHEIGATLTAHSDGAGRGARFVLRLPIDDPKPLLAGVAA